MNSPFFETYFSSIWQAWALYLVAMLYGLLVVPISFARIATNVTRFWGSDYLKIATIKVLWQAYYGRASLLFSLIMIGLYGLAGTVWVTLWAPHLTMPVLVGLVMVSAVMILVGLILIPKKDVRDGQLAFEPELFGFAVVMACLLLTKVL